MANKTVLDLAAALLDAKLKPVLERLAALEAAAKGGRR